MARKLPTIALALFFTTLLFVKPLQGQTALAAPLKGPSPAQADRSEIQSDASSGKTAESAKSGSTTASNASQESKGGPKAAEPNEKEFQDALSTGDLLARSGRFLEALRQFQRAASLHHDKCPECYSKIAQSYVRIGAYDQAAEAVRQALEQKPDDPAALTNMLGVALYLQGGEKHLAEAVDAFHRAIDLSKNSLTQPYFNMGVALMKLGRVDEGAAALKEFMKRVPDGPNSYEAKVVIANPRLAGEQIAPNFKVKTAAGQEVSVEGYRGKVLLLDFWASWCGPCREEMPAVKAVWQKYKSHPFMILGVDMDEDRSAFDQYVKSEGLSWPQYLDAANSNLVARLYGVDSIPQTILIDQDGVVRAAGLRGPELYGKIDELLKKLASGAEAAGQSGIQSRN